MARLSFAVALALACLAASPVSAEQPLRSRSSVIRTFEGYEVAAQQRRLDQRRRVNDLTVLRRELERARVRAGQQQRLGGASSLGNRAPWAARGPSSVAAR